MQWQLAPSWNVIIKKNNVLQLWVHQHYEYIIHEYVVYKYFTHEYRYEYPKFDFEYEYWKFVLEYNSSTSTKYYISEWQNKSPMLKETIRC